MAMDGWTEPPDHGSLFVKRKVRSGSILIDKAFASVFNMSRQTIVNNTWRIYLRLMPFSLPL
jgi:hypothetical protein